MEIIFYRKQNVARDFEEALGTSFSPFTAYTSMTSFCTRLRHTPTQGVVIVLAIADEKELTTLMSIRHMIEDAPIILILPTQDAALRTNAHKLHPRFIGDLENGTHEVIAVIHKILTREEPTLAKALSGPLKN